MCRNNNVYIYFINIQCTSMINEKSEDLKKLGNPFYRKKNPKWWWQCSVVYVTSLLVFVGSKRDIWRQKLAERYKIAKAYNLQSPSVRRSRVLPKLIYVKHVGSSLWINTLPTAPLLSFEANPVEFPER